MRIGLDVRPIYSSISRYLPRALSLRIERMLPKARLTSEQFSRIELLGSKIGLEREDIIAAVDGPSLEPGIPGRSRVMLFVSIVAIIIVATAAILLVWTVVDPETSPIHTYTPGSLYGTIKPGDFSNS